MVDNYYEILGITKESSSDEIKKAYRKKALENHPDKGGNEDDFKKITEAYEILSNNELKGRYDRGEDLKDSQYSHHFPHDIFNHFMNMHINKRQLKRKDYIHNIKISLEEVYTGIQKTLKVSLDKYCLKCNEKCNECHGTGMVNIIRNMGFMQVHQQAICNNCNGNGEKIKSNCNCNCSNGKIEEIKVCVLNIRKGIQSGEKIKYEGYGEQARNETEISGDLYFEIEVLEHPHFIRGANDNLIYKLQITFIESIVGKEINIPHFKEHIKMNINELGIIQPEIGYILKGKGLKKNEKFKSVPSASSSDTLKDTGDLILTFKIEYPNKKLSIDNLNKLQEILTNIF